MRKTNLDLVGESRDSKLSARPYILSLNMEDEIGEMKQYVQQQNLTWSKQLVNADYILKDFLALVPDTL